MIGAIFLFCLGLFFVIKGGDWFVDSATSIAEISGLPKIFIGATIVSLATTLPELIVSVTATYQGETVMAVGNGIGSIICNTGFILSISTLLGKIIIKDNDFKMKAFILIACLLTLIACGLDGKINKFEAFILILILIFYMYYNIRLISNNNLSKLNFNPKNISKKNLRKIILFFILGICFIILGSNLIIKNGVILAKYLNVPTAVISLTIIALGTSLPELVTGIASLIKGNEELAVGNILGANILNAVLVIGTSGLLSDLSIIPQNITVDLPIALLLSSIMIVPSLFTKKISKLQGIVMLCLYFSYILFTWKNVP